MVTMAGRSPSASFGRCTRTGTGGHLEPRGRYAPPHRRDPSRRRTLPHGRHAFGIDGRELERVEHRPQLRIEQGLDVHLLCRLMTALPSPRMAATRPPSTGRSIPLMKLASSERRNTAPRHLVGQPSGAGATCRPAWRWCHGPRPPGVHRVSIMRGDRADTRADLAEPHGLPPHQAVHATFAPRVGHPGSSIAGPTASWILSRTDGSDRRGQCQRKVSLVQGEQCRHRREADDAVPAPPTPGSLTSRAVPIRLMVRICASPHGGDTPARAPRPATDRARPPGRETGNPPDPSRRGRRLHLRAMTAPPACRLGGQQHFVPIDQHEDIDHAGIRRRTPRHAAGCSRHDADCHVLLPVF